MKSENKPTEATKEFEAQLSSYVSNCATRRVLEYYAATLEDMVEDIDNEIAEMDRCNANDEANALAIVRNALNSVRIDLDLKAADAKLKSVQFEKIRDLTK